MMNERRPSYDELERRLASAESALRALRDGVVAAALLRLPTVKLLSAQDAKTGIEMAQTHRPNLILLDIHLPEMNGFQVFEHLGSHERTKDIPVIALSADAMPENVNKALTIGFHEYLTKPLDIRRFLSVVEEYLGDMCRDT